MDELVDRQRIILRHLLMVYEVREVEQRIASDDGIIVTNVFKIFEGDKVAYGKDIQAEAIGLFSFGKQLTMGVINQWLLENGVTEEDYKGIWEEQPTDGNYQNPHHAERIMLSTMCILPYQRDGIHLLTADTPPYGLTRQLSEELNTHESYVALRGVQTNGQLERIMHRLGFETINTINGDGSVTIRYIEDLELFNQRMERERHMRLQQGGMERGPQEYFEAMEGNERNRMNALINQAYRE